MNRLLLVALVLLLGSPASAQFGARPRSTEEVVTKAEAKLTPTTAKRGETVTWSFTVELIPDWHTYPPRQPAPEADSFTSKVKPHKPGALVCFGVAKGPPNPKTKAEPALKIKELRF